MFPICQLQLRAISPPPLNASLHVSIMILLNGELSLTKLLPDTWTYPGAS